MKALYMGSKTADQYNMLFNSFKGATGWNEEALMDQYRKGLTDSLRAKIYNCETLPKTLKGWQEKADRLNRQELEYSTTLSTFAARNLRNATWQPGTPFFQTPTTRRLPTDSLYDTAPASPHSNRPTNTQTTTPESMDIDHTAHRPTPTCFKCQRRGHLAHNAPLRFTSRISPISTPTVIHRWRRLQRDLDRGVFRESATL